MSDPFKISKMGMEAHHAPDPRKKPLRRAKPLNLGTTYFDKPEPKYGRWGPPDADPPAKKKPNIYQSGRRAGEIPAYKDSPVAQAQVARHKAYAEQVYRKKRKPSSRVKVRRVKQS